MATGYSLKYLAFMCFNFFVSHCLISRERLLEDLFFLFTIVTSFRLVRRSFKSEPLHLLYYHHYVAIQAYNPAKFLSRQFAAKEFLTLLRLSQTV